MRETERIDRILLLIKDLWMKTPDQRFGQLLINNGIIKDDLVVWKNEDNDLEEYLNILLKREK